MLCLYTEGHPHLFVRITVYLNGNSILLTTQTFLFLTIQWCTRLKKRKEKREKRKEKKIEDSILSFFVPLLGSELGPIIYVITLC